MNEDLMFRLHQRLAGVIFDGTEAHGIIDDLVDAVRNAHDDPVRIATARLDAKTRIRFLIAECVHIDAITNFLEDW
jgi:hypothetical protein